MEDKRVRTLSRVAFGCGAVAVLCALLPPFFLLLGALLFGIAAIVCGAIARRKSRPSEAAAIGIALGIVAILMVPAIVLVAEEAQGVGRDCAINPAGEAC